MDDTYYPSPARTEARMEEPRLRMPILMSVLAVIFFTVALKARLPDSWRLLCVLLGVVCSIWAAVTGLDWALWRSGAHVQRLREFYYGPVLEMARIVQGLNARQLEVLEAGGMLTLQPGPHLVEGRVHWMVHTKEIDIPLIWMYEHLALCEEKFPLLPVQHGLSDNTERARRRAFNNMMTNQEWQLAVWAAGNQACEWVVPNMASVYDALGLEG